MPEYFKFITTPPVTKKYREGYNQIDWSKKPCSSEVERRPDAPEDEIAKLSKATTLPEPLTQEEYDSEDFK